MAGPVLADRVKETTSTTGTGSYQLDGAAANNYRTFVSGVGSGNITFYACVDDDTSDWEVGVGTVTAGTPDTLSRDTILASSNGGAAVDWGAGSKAIWCGVPADKLASAVLLPAIQPGDAGKTFVVTDTEDGISLGSAGISLAQLHALTFS